MRTRTEKSRGGLQGEHEELGFEDSKGCGVLSYFADAQIPG